MALSMPYWDALFPRKLRIQSHMQAAGAEAKDRKNNSNRPKLNAKAQGQRGRKQATCMKSHFQKREEKKTKGKPNWTILSCCILFCAEVFPSSSLPFFPFLLFVFSPAHIHTIFTPYCPSLQFVRSSTWDENAHSPTWAQLFKCLTMPRFPQSE